MTFNPYYNSIWGKAHITTNLQRSIRDMKDTCIAFWCVDKSTHTQQQTGTSYLIFIGQVTLGQGFWQMCTGGR